MGKKKTNPNQLPEKEQKIPMPPVKPIPTTASLPTEISKYKKRGENLNNQDIHYYGIKEIDKVLQVVKLENPVIPHKLLTNAKESSFGILSFKTKEDAQSWIDQYQMDCKNNTKEVICGFRII